MDKESDQATVTTKKDSNNKVIPDSHFAQEIAHFKQNRKLIIEEEKVKKKSLNILK